MAAKHGELTIEFRIYSDLTSIPLIPQQWDRLVKESGVGGVFLSHAWIHSWWKHFGHDHELLFVTAEKDDRIVAFAPLMVDSKKTVRFIGDLNGDYLGFVIPGQDELILTGFFNELRSVKSRWRVLHLRNIVREDESIRRLKGASSRCGLYLWNNYTSTAPYLPLRGNENAVNALWDKYSFRRSQKQLEAQGRLSFQVFKSESEAAEYWLLLAKQNLLRSKQRGIRSQFENSNYLSFLREIFASDPEGEHIHFSALFLNDKPVAMHFGIICWGRLMWYKASFDTSIEKGSPGVALIKNLVNWAQKMGLEEFDFTIGDEAFKDRFCSDARVVDEYRLYQSAFRYYVDQTYWRARKVVKDIVKVLSG